MKRKDIKVQFHIETDAGVLEIIKSYVAASTEKRKGKRQNLIH